MKDVRRYIRRILLTAVLLLAGGAAHEAWAAYKVTYHILTLPIDNSIYHMDGSEDVINGKRLEAVRVVDNNATIVELPAAYKSPLAKDFKYYANTDVTSHDAVAMYNFSGKNKSHYYEVNGGATNIGGNAVSSNMDVYVTYEYDEDNTIVKLDGSEGYNLTMSSGFIAFNRGRNNRLAVIKEELDIVQNKELVSEDFSQLPTDDKNNVIPGTKISTYWQSNDNKNTKSYVAGQFHFIFKFEGSDPYNIIISTTYDRDYAYLEKHGSENSQRYKWYKGSHLFRPTSEKGYFMASDDHKRYTQSSNTYVPDPMPDITYENLSGYFKTKSSSDLTYNTFALLNNSHSPSDGYVFMLSNFVDGNGDISTPGDYKSAKYNYLTRDGDFNNLTYGSMTLSDATKNYSTDPKIYRIKNYVFKLKKKISEDVLSVPTRISEYYLGEDPRNLVPEELKRKYATFTGAYKDEAHTVSFATFADVDANAETETIGGKDYKVIWLDYETNMPFESFAPGTTYDDLKWYNIHADKNIKYIASWDGSKIVTRNVAYRYPRATHFAFIGDPYDLKIVGRKSSQDEDDNPSTLKYMELADPISDNAGFDTDGTTWGIVYDDDIADNKDCFRLKDFTSGDYLHIKNASGENYPLNGTEVSDEAVRITVDELPKKQYIYYIMRSDGSIAAMSQAMHDPSAKLGYDCIPTSIRSPFLKGVALTFYGSYVGTDGGERAKADAIVPQNAISYAKDTEDGNLQYIVVRYDAYASTSPTVHYIDGTATATFNVRLNGQFIYYDKNEAIEANRIKSSATIEGDASREYNWTLGGSDPYALNIKPQSVNKYIKIDSWPHGDEEGEGATVSWSDTPPSSKYIIKSSSDEHSYEVMGATGEDYDAMEESFNFGRPTNNTVKMYSDWAYLSGSDVLRFELVAPSARAVTYHLVDIKNNDVLLSVQTRQESTDAPSFPPDYRSPLVETYRYWSSLTDAQSETGDPRTTVGASGDIWVTYTANNLVDMSGRTMYLMKYAMGDQFRQEDGVDGLLPPMSEFVGTTDERKYRYQAVYPYCNGDGNFFVYGQEQYDLQQQGAASTRTRWAWYVESVYNDPYHVKISSRQQETYPAGSGNDYNAYFQTCAETFDGSNHVVTTLAWPGISGVQGTEYMVLGSAGQFRLLTSDEISDGTTTERRAVNSFEQYWKTWNTIRKVVLGDKNATAKQSDPNTVPAEKNTPVAIEADKDNRTYLSEDMGWHSYEQWAYAIRWNDYNVKGEKNKKGWEPIEHWYQTVNMGEGYFNFVPTTIDPVLILLDKHGWEIMRKPLPSSPDDPDKYAKYDAIRPYDSPMVKEYHFWTKSSKRSGFHQYYNLDQRVAVDGEPFVSTSLTSLPPFDAPNVHDAKGNLLDQYVTYVVKDEYVKSLGMPFMIRQDNHFAYNDNDATAIGTGDVPATGGMSQYIIDNAGDLTVSGSKKNELWYLKPNANIDDEMGYTNYAHDWTNDYTKTDFSASGFDPYNIQISSVYNDSKYFVTDATEAHVHDGSILGNGTTCNLDEKKSVSATLEGGMDNRTLQMTNATFMAVQDKDGNMQLMPRFDQEKRIKDFSALVHTDDAEVEKTYTKLYRPLVYNYHIIDNSGSESLRYQSGGDLLPQTPEWFQSRLAKDYTYHTATPCTDENMITESLEGVTLTDNNVYVRYSYDEDADLYQMLKGKWLTMALNEKDAVYSEGVKQGSTKPTPVDVLHKDWQWKFIATSQTVPDPYAVCLYNRNVDAGTPIAVNEKTKFALLNWYDNNGVDASAYTLAVAGKNEYSYDFVNGADMTVTIAATTANEPNVKSTSCSYSGTNARIELNDDVQHTYTYKVYTNDDPVAPAHEGKYGVFAVGADQDISTVMSNDYVPTLPEEIKSPLLNMDQFRYYGAETDMGNEEMELKNIFGLYDDIVYVRYTDYDLNATEYKVPNVRNATSETIVARDESSNDAALDINENLIYNIFWYDDEIMMADNEGSILSVSNHDLDGADAFVWQFEGNDPYAIKIKHKKSGKFAVGADALAETATATFMLLPSIYDSEWQYGVLQVTGNSQKLSGYGDALTADAVTEPNKFIIFGLSTHKVIYHLIIAKTCPDESADPLPADQYVDIPYRETKGGTETQKRIYGSSQRDLTTGTPAGATYQLGETINGLTYCVDEGHITLGDPLKVPDELKRPNCKYFYYVEGIYTNEDCDRSTHLATDLDAQYRGLQITEMGTEPELLGKTVRINVEYQFNDGLPTNNGSDFVTAPDQNKWFTVETGDDTPLLAQYTGAAGFKMQEGRESHYTNDYLWSPVGDPYGFKMYNRYEYKTNGQTTHVMTTESAPADGGILKLLENTGDYASYAIYELFAGDTDGYFFMRPLLNNGVAIYNDEGTMKLSAANATEYTFGLSLELLKPYYDRAGYVGGLTTEGKVKYAEAEGDLQKIQAVVYDDAYIVPFTPGYYRLHSQPDIKDLPQRYLSGYTHKTELTENIPMHFYEKKGVNTTFEALGAAGYTRTAATQGQLPVSAPEYDPASIFYITGSASAANMSTQGLNVIENKMGEGAATNFYLMDIGGAVLLIHDNATPAERKYFCFDQSDPDKIYDIQYEHDTPTDYAKWCMEPANNMGLYIETHSGGEEEVLTDLWYYSSYCVPFDLLIANKNDDEAHSSNAYTCVASESPWPATEAEARIGLHPKPIGKYNTGTYQDNDYFVPAGTPVLFSTRRATEYIKATIPTNSPSTPISTIFSYEYLEQLLTPWDSDRPVYVFGPKMEGTLSINTSDGTVDAVLPSLGNTNVGFHLNANPNKEAGLTKASWTRNNYYVQHNKIYYRAEGGSGARQALTRSVVNFVPLTFGDELIEQADPDEGVEIDVESMDNQPIYDLAGRRLTEKPEKGFYIQGGKKFFVR